MTLSFRPFKSLRLVGLVAFFWVSFIPIGRAADPTPIQDPVDGKPMTERPKGGIFGMHDYLGGTKLRTKGGFIFFFANGGTYLGLKNGRVVDCGGWVVGSANQGIFVEVHSSVLSEKIMEWRPHQLHELWEAERWRVDKPTVYGLCRNLLGQFYIGRQL